MTHPMVLHQTPFQVLASLPNTRQTHDCQYKPGQGSGAPHAIASSLQVHTCSLTVLRRLLHVVTDEHLGNFLREVFNNKALRDRVLLDVPGRVSGLVLRMESAARRVYKQSRLPVRATEALFCATLVARLREVLFIREQQLGPMPRAWHVWTNQFNGLMDCAIARLAEHDSSSVWLMRWLVDMPHRVTPTGRNECSFDGTRGEAAVTWAITQVYIAWIQTLAMDPEFETRPFIRTRTRT